MFDVLIKKARRESKRLQEAIDDAVKRKAELTDKLAMCERYFQAATRAIVSLAGSDVEDYVSCYAPFPRSKWSPHDIDIKGINTPEYRHLTDSWGRYFDKLQSKIQFVDELIIKLRNKKDELDFWILDKDERWGGLSHELINGQIEEIVRIGRELSMLVIGRGSQISLQYEEGGALASVSTKYSLRRKIFLSLEPLGDQPMHVLDIYKALILHELGHKLLHIGESAKEYRQINRIMRKKVNIDPNFSAIFNILLDEQLERQLRDRKKEWRAWFNRLEFYGRSFAQEDLRRRLSQLGDDANCDLRELEKRGLVKLYNHDDGVRKKHVATVLSAELLTPAFGFSRMEAFFHTLRFRLPRQTVSEEWLRRCLDEIPANFLELDLVSLHNLAFQIYSIIFNLEGRIQPSRFFRVETKAGKIIMLPVPGNIIADNNPENAIIEVCLEESVSRGKKRGGGSEKDTFSNKKTFSPPADPEGEPPPPKGEEIPIEKTRPKKSEPDWDWRFHQLNGGGGPIRISPAWRDLFPEGGDNGGTDGGGSGKSRNKGSKSAKEKMRNPNLSAKEKSRLQQQLKQEAREKRKDNEQKREKPPQPQEISPNVPIPDLPDLDSSEPTVVDQMSSAKEDLAKSLNQMVAQAMEKMAANRSTAIKSQRMTAHSSSVSNNRNTDPDKRFPECENIFELKPDLARQRQAILAARQHTEILRPFLQKTEQSKVMLENQYGGKRIMNSAIKKYLLYREHRIFRDNRFSDLLDFQDTHISVLVDSSASMKNQGRLDKAKIIATAIGECLVECPNIATAFLGYNQSVYLCGSHENLAVNDLEPNGKTNEAAALDFVRREFGSLSRGTKIVVVISDGLPTSCSVAAVGAVVENMSKMHGFRFVCVMLNQEKHPAYRNLLEIPGELDRNSIARLGRGISELLV